MNYSTVNDFKVKRVFLPIYKIVELKIDIHVLLYFTTILWNYGGGGGLYRSQSNSWSVL